MKRSWIITVLLIAIVVIAGFWGNAKWQQRQAQNDVKQLAGTLLSQPRPIQPFSLTDSQEKTFTNDNLKGHWTFMFFGFTHCRTICPTSLSEMKKIFELLPPADFTGKDPVQMVFVTVDPERDEPARMKHYLSAFNPDFIGVTGDDAELTQLRKQLGIMAMRNVNAGKNNMNQDEFDHSASILLVNPNGDFTAVFSTPHSAESIAQDFAKIQRYYAVG